MIFCWADSIRKIPNNLKSILDPFRVLCGFISAIFEVLYGLFSTLFLLTWAISVVLCQIKFDYMSTKHDLKQIIALTKGRSRTKCSIITLIKSSSTRPTEAGQTLCNLCNSVLPVCSRQSKSWIFDDSIAFNQCKNRSRLPFFPFQWRQIQVCTFVQKGIEWLKTNYSHS